MERAAGHSSSWITVAAALAAAIPSCSGLDDVRLPQGLPQTESITAVRIGMPAPDTRAADPDETRLSDINILVFNEYGILETQTFTEAETTGDSFIWNVNLVKNARYSIYACANFGYGITAGTADELKELRYYLAYPDDYSAGMPMSGCAENVMVTGEEIFIPLERLMAKISLSIDRSRLDRDVEFNIRSIKVEGCPRSVTPFNRNRIRDPFGFFPSGFLRKDYETDPLNNVSYDGKSGEVSLYMLENMQGDLLPGNEDETEKVLPQDNPLKEFCSYIEIKAEYLSSSGYSLPGEYLIYRLYPGDNPGNFDVCRNTEYRIRIIPVGSGLNGTEWRTDKTGIGYTARNLELSYDALRFSYIGESMTIQPYLTPGNADEALLSWSSDNEAVAAVSQDGTVRATGEGECTVSCHAEDGSGCHAECKVTVDFLPYYLKIFPGNFIRCRKGDVLNIRCDYFPQDTPFEIGTEEMEYDKNRGIYDYEIGADGRSVTLYTKSRGSGMLYMEAGYPVNQAELIVIVID